MEITAKLISLGNATEGTSAKGPWRNATAIFETQEEYPKTIAVDFFNTKLEEVTKIPLGSICVVKFDVSSREFNGKYYTKLNGWLIVDPQQQQQTQQQPQQQRQPQQQQRPQQQRPAAQRPPMRQQQRPPQQQNNNYEDDYSDDLPF